MSWYDPSSHQCAGTVYCRSLATQTAHRGKPQFTLHLMTLIMWLWKCSQLRWSHRAQRTSFLARVWQTTQHVHSSSVIVSAANCVDRSWYRMNSIRTWWLLWLHVLHWDCSAWYSCSTPPPPGMPPPTPQHNTGANGDYFQFGKNSCVDIGIL